MRSRCAIITAKEGEIMDKNTDYIPRLVWERDQARFSHIVKVLSGIMIFLIAALLIISGAFLYYIRQKDKEWLDFLSQYDFEDYEISTEGGGDANYIGRDGEISYGTNKSEKDDTEGQES